jgi:hypothetical protein
MTTYIPNGPHCGKKETKQFQISQISSIPCTPGWVSNIQSDIWCSSITMTCIDTSIMKWILWTSHYCIHPTDMSSRSSRSSNKSQERVAPTHKTEDIENMDSVSTTSPSRKKIRTPKRQRKISGSGATSVRSLSITLLTAAQSNCWWPK